MCHATDWIMHSWTFIIKKKKEIVNSFHKFTFDHHPFGGRDKKRKQRRKITKERRLRIKLKEMGGSSAAAGQTSWSSHPTTASPTAIPHHHPVIQLTGEETRWCLGSNLDDHPSATLLLLSTSLCASSISGVLEMSFEAFYITFSMEIIKCAHQYQKIKWADVCQHSACTLKKDR